MNKEATTAVPKPPFSVCDRGAFIRKAFIACEVVNVPTFECVVYSIAYDRVEMMHIPVSEMGVNHNINGSQFYVDGHHVMGGPAQIAKTHLAWLRDKALQSGATPDAIRLLARATKPFTKKEEVNMAEKLKAKSKPVKADASELKKAASAAPVGKGKAPPKKGAAKGSSAGIAAIKAAREAKGPDTRKIKPLIKPKDITAREGSFRHEMLTDLLNSKTVQEFRDKDDRYDASCLRYAVDAEIVQIS